MRFLRFEREQDEAENGGKEGDVLHIPEANISCIIFREKGTSVDVHLADCDIPYYLRRAVNVDTVRKFLKEAKEEC